MILFIDFTDCFQDLVALFQSSPTFSSRKKMLWDSCFNDQFLINTSISCVGSACDWESKLWTDFQSSTLANTDKYNYRHCISQTSARKWQLWMEIMTLEGHKLKIWVTHDKDIQLLYKLHQFTLFHTEALLKTKA